MSDFLVWTIIIIIYPILGVISGVVFSTFADLGNYANFKVLMIALFWPLAWALSFLLAFWDWVTER